MAKSNPLDNLKYKCAHFNPVLINSTCNIIIIVRKISIIIFKIVIYRISVQTHRSINWVLYEIAIRHRVHIGVYMFSLPYKHHRQTLSRRVLPHPLQLVK